jgi:hypothetical protein
MRTLRRIAAPVLLAAVLVVALGSCDGKAGGKENEKTPQPSQTTPLPTQASTAPSVNTKPGNYRYANSGLQVTFEISGATGTLTVENGTGHGVDKPALYVLDATDGHRTDLKVIDPQPVPDGKTVEFQVQLPQGLLVKDIGWVDLMLGRDDYGGFVPE